MKGEVMEVRDASPGYASPGYAAPVDIPVVSEGYKHTEVGVIPEDWGVALLGDCLAVKPSYGINAPAVPHSDRLPTYLRITDITAEGSFAPDPAVSVSSNSSENYYLSAGDIVFARTGASVGKSYLYRPSDGPLVYAGFLIRVRPTQQQLLPNFLGAYVSTGRYWQWVKLMSMRSGQPGINGTEYARLPIPLPPLEEQRAIATALSDVDALLEALDRLIAKKRDIKQATMQQLLTAQTRLPGFEGQWARLPLGDIVTFLSGGTPSRNNESFWAGDIPWISASTLRTIYICRSESNVTKEAVSAGSKMAPIGSVLLLVRGSALHNEVLAGLVTKPVCFNQDVKALVPQARLCGQFLALLMHGRAQELLRLVSSAGNTAGVLDTKLIKAFEVQLPPLDEQVAIVAILADMDSELEALQQRRTKTAALKQAMMQDLLTGRTRLI